MQSSSTILMLSWEFPPVIIGGISPHVYELTKHLKDKQTEIHIVTNSAPLRPVHEIVNGLHVHRVNSYENILDFLDWVLQFNLAIVDYVKHQLDMKFDIIHAHDWMVGYAAIILQKQLGVPLVTTIHATEYGRNEGIFTPLQRSIHSIENELVSLSNKIIVCSTYMSKEVSKVHGINETIIEVIPNGIDLHSLSLQEPHAYQREKYARPQDRIVLFLGRLVKEKGVHLLIESAREVLKQLPDCKFIIAGRGPMFAELKSLTVDMDSNVLFAGFVEKQEKNYLLEIADLCVFPSLYEPFGIVALEAMGSGTTVIVSDVGGLSEIVEHNRTGLKCAPGDVQSLTSCILKSLQDPELRQTLSDAGKETVISSYDWNQISAATKEIYAALEVVRS